MSLAASVALLVGRLPAGAQQPGEMMGTNHDSATMAQMGAIHELIMNHDKITRTVKNLPNGIRTTTTSNDPQLARRIKEHAITMHGRVVAGDDPGLPVESEALHAIFRDNAKIRTVVDTNVKGVVVVQTSRDSATVVALQTHAAEVTDLVQRGMTAMHEAMMKNGGMEHSKMPR